MKIDFCTQPSGNTFVEMCLIKYFSAVFCVVSMSICMSYEHKGNPGDMLEIVVNVQELSKFTRYSQSRN